MRPGNEFCALVGSSDVLFEPDLVLFASRECSLWLPVKKGNVKGTANRSNPNSLKSPLNYPQCIQSFRIEVIPLTEAICNFPRFSPFRIRLAKVSG
jgi:hypothetical protein